MGTPQKQASTEKKEETKATEKKEAEKKISLEDFLKIASLGRGSYAEVYLVKKLSNEKNYALKAIDKNFMKRVNMKNWNNF